MKYFLFLSLSVFSLHNAFSQKDSTIYYFEEVGMLINIPSKFEVLGYEENEVLRKKGAEKLEESGNIKIDDSNTKDLISVKMGPSNYFNITLTPYSGKDQEEWELDMKALKDLVYKTFTDMASEESVETYSTKQKIDGLEFDKYHIIIKITTVHTMHFFLYSKLYKGNDLGICYVYLDENIGADFKRIIDSCTFKK